MPNWLTKATGGSARESTDAPQEFQLVCECSEQHTGQRKTRPQRIICQSCGTALFVLPKNVYPPPRERSANRKKRGRKLNRHGAPSGRRLPSAHHVTASIRSGVFGAAGGLGRSVGSAAAATKRRIATSAVSAGRTVRASLTPFRIVVIAMALILLATATVALQSRSLEAARQRLRSESAAGRESLKEEDVVAARNHFALAAAAADRLGVDDAPSREVRQLYHETLAMTNLAADSLFEMLDQAESSRSRVGGLSWEDTFAARFEGRWIVLHAPVRHDADGFVVDLPLRVGANETPVTIRADLGEFDALPVHDGAAVAIFAAPYAGCELNNSEDRWTVTLDGRAGFLWSHSENLRSLGFFDAEWTDQQDVAELLKRQSLLTGGLP